MEVRENSILEIPTLMQGSSEKTDPSVLPVSPKSTGNILSNEKKQEISPRSPYSDNGDDEADMNSTKFSFSIHCKSWKTCRPFLWNLVDNPSSSTAAQVVAIFIMVLIFISCTSFVVETLPQYHQKNVEFWDTLEAVCIGLFSTE